MRFELQPKFVGSTKTYTFDFLSELALGETISTATVTATVWSGSDATPSAIISGVASISGSQVTQNITAGAEGTIYLIKVTITTSTGQTLVGNGLLAVIPDAI